MSTHDVGTRIEAALDALAATWASDDEPWEPARSLQMALAPLRALSDQEIATFVMPLATDARPVARGLVPAVLRYLRAKEEPASWPERAPRYAERILALAASEPHDDVLAEQLAAFVDLGDPRGVQLARRLASHEDASMRRVVASVLTSLAPDVEVDPLLIALSCDPDDDVRSWATFGLRFAEPSEAVRDALFARRDDPHEETRGEALVGLAVHRDPRVVSHVLVALHARPPTWLALEAAEEWPHADYARALSREDLPWDAERVARVRAACVA